MCDAPTVVVMPDPGEEPAPWPALDGALRAFVAGELAGLTGPAPGRADPGPLVSYVSGPDVQLQFIDPPLPGVWSHREYTVVEHIYDPPSLTLFMPPGTAFIRADGDGKVYVRGTPVGDDKEVYRALRELLNLPAEGT
jgi:hypothetical protein